MNAALRLLLISMILLASFQQGFLLNKKIGLPDSLSAPKTQEGLARRPPMGWNSYDCFGMLATEGDIKANADYMAEHLKKYGWEYIVLDYLWYADHLTAENVREKNPVQNIDSYGRLIPSTVLHPSSAGGRGLKPLADYVHGKGLKFGIHIMRGIPIQAVDKNSPVLGTNVRAREIANPADRCSWYAGLCGVDVNKNGGQEYFDSIVRLYAEWGVDYIKADDMAEPYHADEIAALSGAINKCGRPIVLSLSPGPTPLAQAGHVREYANLWRISADFWDEWPKVLKQFELCRAWAAHIEPGHWPDADMLPLGRLSIRTDLKDHNTRWSRLTKDEPITVMSLWSIFRSPLMFGGNMPDNDPYTLSLLTNEEVLAVDQDSANNRELSAKDGLIVWAADVPDSKDKYVALFNTRDPGSVAVTVTWAELGCTGTHEVRDLWARKDLGPFKDRVSPQIPGRGAGLFRIKVR
jgi:alpha-galactosidase